MRSCRGCVRLVEALVVLAALVSILAEGQTASNERTFPQSKAALEKILRTIQGNLAGRLPVLDGFAQPGERPLDLYQRGYFQSSVDVRSTPSGGSIVRVTTKVTAWYSDPAGAHSGYQLLTSNGRLEADLLDLLQEQAAKIPSESSQSGAQVAAAPISTPAHSISPVQKAANPAPVVTPPVAASTPPVTENKGAFTPSLSTGLSAPPRPSTPDQIADQKTKSALEAEAESLEEVLKNTGHPKNLVAVKKSGTPVVSTPSITAKPQFLASAHDEFELLDFNADWVHVRISGLSRGWIWRNSVEMPEGIADTDVPAAAPQTPAADLFHVVREETAPFPGDWQPLRSRNVKIISVQKSDEASKESGANERLEFAKFLLERSYKEIAQKPQDLQGVVVIFDSADGGMIAATAATLQQWVAGTLSDAAMWHQCFFDPPETFDSASSAGSR